MLGELNEMQVNNLLSSQAIGRIGCNNGNQNYIVPVTYAFDGKDIFFQSHEGTKLKMMRRNSKVCFQVDMILNMANWQAVLAFGTFHQLKGKAALNAYDYLHNRVLPLMTSSTIHAHEHEVLGETEHSTLHKPIMCRISINSKTGRFEKQ